MDIYKTHNEKIAVDNMVNMAAQMLAQALLLRHNLAVESGTASAESLASFVAKEMQTLHMDNMVQAAVRKILSE